MVVGFWDYILRVLMIQNFADYTTCRTHNQGDTIGGSGVLRGWPRLFTCVDAGGGGNKIWVGFGGFAGDY